MEAEEFSDMYLPNYVVPKCKFICILSDTNPLHMNNYTKYCILSHNLDCCPIYVTSFYCYGIILYRHKRWHASL